MYAPVIDCKFVQWRQNRRGGSVEAQESQEMPSHFEAPDPRKTLSVRVRSSLHAKLLRIRELWQEKASASGMDPELVKQIDTTYIVERLMLAACDAELAQWGGYAETPEQFEAQLSAIREAVQAPKKRK